MEVREQIGQQLDRLFADAPRTRAAYELREELLANCMDRYEDLTRGGAGSDAALQQVMGSIGSVDELIAVLPGEGSVMGAMMDSQRRRKSALTVAIAVGLYIFAGAVFFGGALLEEMFLANGALIGLIAAGVICIIPTCMLVYNANRWPAYQKKEETVVEDFKAWNSDAGKRKSLRGAISSLLWTLTVVVYMGISFLTGGWHMTWIIFLVTACLESVIALVFRLKEL